MKYLNESTTHGSLVEYQCPLGQKVVGMQIRSCQADGSWSGKMPRCEGTAHDVPPQQDKYYIFTFDQTWIVVILVI